MKAPDYYWFAPKEEIHKENLVRAEEFKPGVIPYFPEEIQNFDKVLARFRAGEVEEKDFIPFRLLQGTYGQRQPDRQMFRIKIAGGILTPEAMETLGTIAEQFAPLKKGHVTTRENVQFHHMTLENCAEAMRLLGSVGLSTREACGNTLRNVVGSPTAGVCPDELFDVTPYLVAYVRFGVRHPVTQSFPRKFKTSFTGCPSHDAIASRIHDFSFVAQTRKENGKVQQGFRVYVGGGSSIMPRYAQLLYDFIPVSDLLRVSQAVWTVFNKADELRPHRMMSRIKVLIEKMGLDVFKKNVEEELKSIPPLDPAPLMNLEEIHREVPPNLNSSENSNQILPQEFLLWKKTNAFPQKQAGYFVVYAKIPLGDIYAPQWPVLAGIVRKYTGGRARTTQEQNLAFRWVPEIYLYEVWKELKTLGFAEPQVHTIHDVVACPATDSCKLGITSSMGLARTMEQAFGTWNGILDDPLVKKIRIKISGCPNGCAQHHIAEIGFQGGSVKGPSGEQIPAYDVLVGGRYGGTIEGMRFGTRLNVKVPARRIPEFLRELLLFYKSSRLEGEEFQDFVLRTGTKPLEEIAGKYKITVPFGKDTLPFYMDWEKTVPFRVERGEGECAV